MYETMQKPISLGTLQLKNRIVFAPTTMGVSDQEYYQKIERIAAGGCAMIVIGDVPVGKRGFKKTLYQKKGRKYYGQLAQITQKYNCKICAQLHQSDADWKSMFRYVPRVLAKKISMDQLRPLLNAQIGPYISSLSVKKVQTITHAFGEAAAIVADLGFDMVQVHGDRMCGSFSSAIFNSRKDVYGQSAENRARFAVECISAIRENLPYFPVEFKLAVRQEQPHYGNAGVLLEELPIFIPMLEQAGVNSFHVTLANHGDLSDTIPSAKHLDFSQEGCFLYFCDLVRQCTALPICGVGGLTKPAFIEQQLKAGRIDYAAMSRQLIADPQWVNKVFSGKEETIQYCIRCNQKCLGGLQQHRGVHCIFEKGLD